MKLCVCGLGKLGSPMAAVYRSAGHEVVGCDLNEEFVDKIQHGVAPVEETGLQDLLATCGHIPAMTDIGRASANADIIFVVVPTPSQDDGAFSAEYVRNALFALAARYAGESGRYLVINIVSTVSPGTMATLVGEFEAATGGTCGRDFGVVYNPEFIAIGSVIKDLRNPSFALVGESDTRAGDIVESFYKTIHDAPVRRMSLASAEIAKLSLNVALTERISFANTISELCERVPGASARDVLTAIGTDRRIGHRYLSSGTAFGGPCFPRDCRAFMVAAGVVGAQSFMPSAIDAVNAHQTVRLADIVTQEVAGLDKIGILGTTYKTDTSLTTESAGKALADELARRKLWYEEYDPRAPNACRSLDSAADTCRVLVLTTPWPEFDGLLDLLGNQPDHQYVLVDCWNRFGGQLVPDNIKYIALGEA
jgi:UDPglucose 6-dehydrogenase